MPFDARHPRRGSAGVPVRSIGAHFPILIVWDDRDIAFRASERERFEALFPVLRTHVLEGAGHYLWDDAEPRLSRVAGPG